MKRWIGAVAVTLFLLTMLSACGKVDVTGVWSQEDGKTALSFREDGSGVVTENGEVLHSFAYTVSGSRVTLTGTEGTFEYRCNRQEATLTLTGSDGNSATLTRTSEG